MIPVIGCPPKPESIVKALYQAGINVDPARIENIDRVKGKFMKKSEDRPEFEEGFYTVD